MRRIPRQIRLDPTYDKRVREYIGSVGGEMTVTDVIHKALADMFRVQDGGATLERVASDVHEVGRIIAEDRGATAAAIGEVKKSLERTATAQILEQTAMKTEIAELKQQVEQLTGAVREKMKRRFL